MSGALKSRSWAAGLALGLALVVASVPADAARPRVSSPDAGAARGLPDNQLAPQSVQLVKAGEELLATRNTAEAIRNF